MKERQYVTTKGQAIVPYSPLPHFNPARVTHAEGGHSYRLCQVMPPIPQRLEWIRTDHIREHSYGGTD